MIIRQLVNIVNRIKLEKDRVFVNTMFVDEGKVERSEKDDKFGRIFTETRSFIVISVIFAEVEDSEISKERSDKRKIMGVRRELLNKTRIKKVIMIM